MIYTYSGELTEDKRQQIMLNSVNWLKDFLILQKKLVNIIKKSTQGPNHGYFNIICISSRRYLGSY